VVTFLQLVGASCFIALICFSAIFNNGKQVEIANQLIKIESTIINRYGFFPNCESLKRNTNFFIVSLLTFYFVFIQSLYYFIFHEMANDLDKWIVFYLIQCCIVSFYSKHIVNVFTFIEMSGKFLNDQLKAEVLQFENNLIDKSKNTLCDLAVLKFDELFLLYDDICEMLHLISDGYGIAMFGLVVFNLIGGIVQVYVVFFWIFFF
jgi:7tm Chemosensory receptor